MATQRAVGLAAKTRPVQAYKDAALDARRERARLSKREFKPIPDRPRGSDKYRQQQKLAMQSFFTQVYETDPDDAYQADPDQIWLDLCNRGTEAYNGAIHCCQQFLKDYVRASERPFRKEEECYQHPDKWTLSTTQSHKSRGSGPVWQISHWIASDLANELELTKKQTFVKVAATTADILIVLMTLWTRANDIPCDRETRVAFHARILLASMGGFRRGTLDKLKYSQIKMHLSRPGKKAVENMSVSGDLILYYNKQQTAKICTSQDDVIQIGLKNTNDPLVDLVRIVAAQAIKDGAFDPPYHSWEDLEKPRDAEYAELHWKKEMLDREIFALFHETERALWYRTLLVAGYQSFISSQRNYVLSNSNKVFEEYYQPRNFDGDLVQVAFGEHARGNDELFKRMREASFKRNENAPIYVTQEDLESFQKREDISELCVEYARLKETARLEKRAKHKEGKPETKDKSEADKEAARVLFHISKTIANLCASTLKRFRAEFFERKASQLKAKKAANKSHLLSAIQLDQLDSSKSTCYICGSSFTRRKNLTRHNREFHHHEGLYDRPFPCPASKA
ncbi:hypothetical protein PspLS_06266, partial [Pyricularia sp. CBS 133598]